MKTIVKIAGIAVPLALTTVTAQAGGTNLPSTNSATIVTATAGSYIKNVFSFGLSRGTGIAYSDDTNGVYANAGNIKGSTTFGAATTGGGVQSCGVAPDSSNGYKIASPALSAAGGTGCN